MVSLQEDPQSKYKARQTLVVLILLQKINPTSTTKRDVLDSRSVVRIALLRPDANDVLLGAHAQHDTHDAVRLLKLVSDGGEDGRLPQAVRQTLAQSDRKLCAFGDLLPDWAADEGREEEDVGHWGQGRGGLEVRVDGPEGLDLRLRRSQSVFKGGGSRATMGWGVRQDGLRGGGRGTQFEGEEGKIVRNLVPTAHQQRHQPSPSSRHKARRTRECKATYRGEPSDLLDALLVLSRRGDLFPHAAIQEPKDPAVQRTTPTVVSEC